MKKKLQAMLKKAQERKENLVKRSESSEDLAELRSIHTSLEETNEEIRGYESLLAEIEANESNEDDPNPEARTGEELENQELRALGTFNANSGAEAEIRAKAIANFDTQGQELRDKNSIIVPFEETEEERATTIASGTLVVETKYKRTLAAKFNEVSSLIDRVNAVGLMGGNAYEAGFEVSDGEAGETTETGDYVETDPVFGYVTVGKAKITAYAEITDEVKNLPNVDYRAKVVEAVRNAIRKRITKQILIGAGTSNTFTGIFNAPEAVVPAATDIDIADIDADTLDEIILGYGGDEDVDGDAVLVINKATLKNFAKVRSTDGKKLYKITKNGNTGTISSEDSWNVPYVLNSAVAGFDAVAEDAYFGAYGKLEAYEMPIFSQLEITESTDYKFRSGQIAFRGVIWAGGNVTMHKGFVRLKKNAVA